MALRMMVYQGLLYQDLIKRREVLADGRLPPILPIVLYNGSQRWTAVTDVFELIPPVPGLVEQFKPRQKYLLVEENAYSDSDLASVKNLVAAMFRIEHPTTPEAVRQLVGLLSEWLIDRPDIGKMFARWIRATLMRKPKYRIVLPELDDLQELNNMLSEQVEVWAHDYEAKGVQKGMQQGEALSLQRLLTKRFGDIPSDITARIAAASVAEIERWFDLAIDATGYDGIFGPTKH